MNNVLIIITLGASDRMICLFRKRGGLNKKLTNGDLQCIDSVW